MGVYERHLGPRLVDWICSMENVAEQRAAVVPRAFGTVLEIGLGSGLNLPHYDPARVREVIGVDPSPGFTALGRKRIEEAPVPVRLIEAPAEDMPLADGSADCAILTYTLCSVAEPAKALAELRRVLKPGAPVFFVEHGRAADPGVARWQNRLNPVWRVIACGCNLNRDTIELMREAGFEVDEVEHFYLRNDPKVVGFHSRGVAHAT